MPTIGLFLMTKRSPRRPMSQLVNPEEGQQAQEQQKSMFHPANPGDAHPQKNKLRKKENLTWLHLIFLSEFNLPFLHIFV